MCGEIDEQVVIGQDLLEQIRVMSKMLGLSSDTVQGTAPRDLDSSAGRAAYMEQVFRSGLTRAMTDIASAEQDQTIDALASQAIALARLAGFIAGQLPPEADLFRSLIEAVSAGHSEPKEMAAEYRRINDHHHGHSHDHDDDHHHHHGHAHDHHH